jgi:hypothetical protein
MVTAVGVSTVERRLRSFENWAGRFRPSIEGYGAGERKYSESNVRRR